MRSLRDDLYEDAFRLWNMEPSPQTGDFGPAGVLHTFDRPEGHGTYWAYFRDNMFAVNMFDMAFSQPGEMRYRHAEHLSIAQYEAVEGVTQNTGKPLRARCACAYVGSEGDEYRARYEAGAHARATSITISPDYYRDYLQARFGSPEDVRADFALVDGRGDLPALADLFRRIRAYRGSGVTAELFYEGVVAEAVSIIIDKAHEIAREEQAERERTGADGLSAGHRGAGTGSMRALSREDAQIVSDLCAFIAGNLDADLSCETLAARAFVGQTKLKHLFKAATGTTPVAYVNVHRMERARDLIDEGELPIAHIANLVGYRNAGAFSVAFRRHFGCAPTEARMERGSVPRSIPNNGTRVGFRP